MKYNGADATLKATARHVLFWFAYPPPTSFSCPSRTEIQHEIGRTCDGQTQPSLSVHVKPRKEDCKGDTDDTQFTEHFLTSWDGMMHEATQKEHFDYPVWPHPGGISVATASGYYVGFDGGW